MKSYYRSAFFLILIVWFNCASASDIDKKVTLIIPNLPGHSFWDRLISNTQGASRDLGVELSVLYSNNETQLVKIANQLDSNTDAVIIAPVWPQSELALNILDKRRIPFITINSRLKNPNLIPRQNWNHWLGSIYADEIKAGKVLAGRMVDKDTKSVLIVGGQEGDTVSDDRLKGVLDYFEEKNFDIEVDTILQSWLPNNIENQLDLQLQNNQYDVIMALSGDLGVLVEELTRDKRGVHPQIGTFDWGRRNVESVNKGTLEVAVGGHYLDGAFAITLLVDYFNGYDFASQNTHFDSLMLPLGKQNFQRLHKLTKIDQNIDYSLLTLTHNPTRFRFDFDIDSVSGLLSKPVRSKHVNLGSDLYRWIAKNRTIKFGSDKYFKPYEYVENGEYKGLMSSYLYEISLVSGLDFEMISGNETFSEVKKLLELKEIDIIPIIGESKSRSKYMNFTDEVFSEPLVFFGNKKATPYTGPKAFRGKKVGSILGYFSTQILEDKYPAINVLSYPTPQELFEGLINQEVEAIVMSLSSGTYYINNNGLDEFSAIAPLNEKLSLRIGVRNDWPELVEILNISLKSMDESKKKEIFDYWVNMTYQVGISEDQIFDILIYPVLILFGVLITFLYSRQKLSQQSLNNLFLATKFKTVFDNSTDMIIIYDKSGFIVESNQLTKKTLGIEKGKSVHIRDVFFKDSLFDNKLNDYKEYDLVSITSIDNEEMTYQISTKLISLNGDDVYISTARNISDNLYLESRVEDERKLLRRLLNSSPLSVCVVTSGIPVYVNPAMNRLTGMVENQPMSKLFENESELNRFVSMIHDSLESSFEIRIRGVNGCKLDVIFHNLTIDYQTLEGESVSSIVCWLIDITEFRTIEKQLIVSKMESDTNAKNKSDFLAKMSHEIRTPLNAIMGMTTLALDNINHKDHSFRYLEHINIASDSLLNVINDILDFSKIEAGELEISSKEFDLYKLVKDSVFIASSLASSKNLEVTINPSSDLPRYWYGDSNRISQVLVNLLNNAVKFTDSGFVILNIKWKSSCHNQGDLLFSVFDTGKGMSPQELETIFLPFKQTSNTNDSNLMGTGLGLTISNRLVNLMGGELTVLSHLHYGSKFNFNIPSRFRIEDRECNVNVEHVINLVGPISVKLAIIKNILDETGFNYNYIDDISNSDLNDDILTRRLNIFVGVSCRNINGRNYDVNNTIAIVDRLDKDIILLDREKTLVLDGAFFFSDITDYILGCRNLKNKSVLSTKQHDINPRYIGASALVVEDNKINQELICEMLNPYKLDIIVCNNGQECLDVLATKKIDIIFMDCQMPILNGFETTKAIKNDVKYSFIPIVAVTASVTSEEINKIYESGMDAYISKPINIDNLYDALETWLFGVEQDAVSIKEPELITPPCEKFNINHAIANCNNNEILLHRLLDMYIIESEDYIEKISQVNLMEGIIEVRSLVHKLKGTSNSLGATLVSNICTAIEDSTIDSGYLDENKLDVLIDAIYETVIIMKGFLDKQDTSSEERAANEKVETIKKNLLSSLEGFDAKSIDYSFELLKCDDLDRKLVTKIHQLTLNFDFKQALELLKKL